MNINLSDVKYYKQNSMYITNINNINKNIRNEMIKGYLKMLSRQIESRR